MNVVRTMRQIISNEGIFRLEYGLSASVGRQAIFSTLRHGIYNVCKAKRPGMGLPEQIVVSSAVGGVCAFLANPCDVIMVRMQADGHWKPHERRGYRHLFDGLIQTARTEGVPTLWRGCTP